MNEHTMGAKPAYNKRPQGSSLQLYLMMEILQAVDQHCFSCPSRRRFGASVTRSKARVLSAPLRPGRALPLDESPLPGLPLGTQSNVLRAQRCAQCLGSPNAKCKTQKAKGSRAKSIWKT